MPNLNASDLVAKGPFFTLTMDNYILLEMIACSQVTLVKSPLFIFTNKPYSQNTRSKLPDISKKRQVPVILPTTIPCKKH